MSSFKERFTTIKARCAEFLNKERSLAYVCFLLSAYTLIAFHYPFFSCVAENVSCDLNGAWIVCSMFILMLALNYLVYYLLLYLCRVVGKYLIALLITGNAVVLYFVNTYNVLIDMDMMSNVFNTQFSEASSFFSWTAVAYALILGVAPSILLCRKQINYGSIWKFLLNFIAPVAIVGGVVAGNYKNIFWVDRHAPVIGSKLMPWSYIVNSVRYYNHWKRVNQKEIQLPDAESFTDSKDICVLIIGESARSANFSLYGYDRETNPLMKADSVIALKARASNTNTLNAVRAILQHSQSKELYEILPNYLSRNGVDVIWRSSNWGTPPLHIEKNLSKGELKEQYPEADNNYDGILFHGLKEQISESKSDKIFIGIHTYTSHGPEYYSNTPDEFKRFMPECRTVEMANAKYEELINAYDNTILYTDHLVHSVIEMLQEFPDRRCCVIFVSDHGESLGEGGLYMHGVPLNMAPAEQLDIPFIVWTSDRSKVKDIELAGHHNIYHSVLKFLGIKTSFYDETKNIFE
ncbi:MAG: DUF1705 domain-containing protein [Alistipes sp.]|nr:DUF1705 domain-containing protein [Alistipes sp.]